MPLGGRLCSSLSVCRSLSILAKLYPLTYLPLDDMLNGEAAVITLSKPVEQIPQLGLTKTPPLYA